MRGEGRSCCALGCTWARATEGEREGTYTRTRTRVRAHTHIHTLSHTGEGERGYSTISSFDYFDLRKQICGNRFKLLHHLITAAQPYESV
jgi:hypothetical protein